MLGGGGGWGLVRLHGYEATTLLHIYFHIVLKLEMNSYDPSEGDTVQICLVIQSLTATGETSLSTQVSTNLDIQEDGASTYQYHTNVTL